MIEHGLTGHGLKLTLHTEMVNGFSDKSVVLRHSARMALILLTIAAFISSAVSGTIGMGGGILLLSFMTFFMTFEAIVPVHGVVQLVSNSSRAYMLRKNVISKVVVYFVMGLPVGLALSIWLLSAAKGVFWPKYLICAMIFYVVFKPKKLPELQLPFPAFVFVGFLVGIFGLLVGATGPLIAPFFVRKDFKKEQIVATKATVQILGHLVKIPTFIYLSFNYFEYLPMIIALSLATVIGTRTGVKILGKISEKTFILLFKAALLFSALRILYLGLMSS